MEGPTVYFDLPYYAASANSSIDIGVGLQGQNSLPVFVQLSAELRSLVDANTLNNTDNGLLYTFNQTNLRWDPGESGLQSVALHLQGDATALAQGGLVLSLDSADNADCSDMKSHSVVSGMAQNQLTVGFDLVPNQV